MQTKRTTKPSTKPQSLEPLLERAARNLAGCQALRTGTILVRAGGRDYYVDCAPSGARLIKGTARPDRPPIVEISGDVRSIRGVLKGEADALKRFLAGGFRVRGDLRYFSDLAVELGILKNPL